MGIRLEIACVRKGTRDVYYSFNHFTMKRIRIELDVSYRCSIRPRGAHFQKNFIQFGWVMNI